MATRRKPHDPAKAAQAALERKQRDQEAQRLEAQGATVKRDRGGHIISAYRSNVFNLLLSRGTITADHYIAASDFCDAWATWKGLDGGPDHSGEKVDGSSGAKELVTDRMIRAGKSIAWTLDQMQKPHARLLCAYAVATVEEDRPMDWRGVVERETQITVRDQQRALVVAMVEALREICQGTRAAA